MDWLVEELDAMLFVEFEFAVELVFWAEFVSLPSIIDIAA
jgi:hypothetical protein